MTNATDIIKDMLTDVGLEHQYNAKKKKVSIDIGNMCKVEIHKYPYGSGYGINTMCSKDNDVKLNSVADFVDIIRISNSNKKFELYATSNDRTLGAGKIDIRIPIKIEPKIPGKYEIDCTSGDGNDCNIGLLHIKDIRDEEEDFLE